MSQKKILSIIFGIGFYLAVTGASAWAFGAFAPAGEGAVVPTAPARGEAGGLVIDPGEPRDQQCPINGKLFTKTERAAWEKRRPLFVMVENHTDSRPQSGLTAADVVYEAVAEGGITRFGVVYYCGAIAKDTKLGPVRSARSYFLDWASEYNYPLYAHVGGGNCSRDEGTNQCTTDPRAMALEQIQKYGWGGSKGNDLNQFSIGYPTFWRNYERLGRTVATEHTMETTSEKLWLVGEKRGWTAEGNNEEQWSKKFIPWTFTDPSTSSRQAGQSTGGDVRNISFEFWEGYQDFAVRWEYNPETNLYGRIMGGEPHKDLETGEQITASVVVVQFVKEEGPVDIHKHMLYGTMGKGDALVFQNGQAVRAKWQKADRVGRTKFTDEKGKEISFVGGQMWIEVVPAGNTVEY